MRYGVFLSGNTNFDLTLEAQQTGTHTVTAVIQGGAQTSTFEATEGDSMLIPNIFPEYGSWVFTITQPDGTLFDDGSACEMTIEIAPTCPGG